MAELLTEWRGAMDEPSTVERTGPTGRANRRVLSFLHDAQQIWLEEAVFVAEEWLERARTETHLFAEFIAKMAGAHSVSNVRTMYEECGQHQIDFIRRDCDRIFKHGQRMADAVSGLFGPKSEV
jgi:hypothetical protein